MNKNEFDKVVGEIIDDLYAKAKVSPSLFTTCTKGDDFEQIVYDTAKEIISKSMYPIILHYNRGSHAFPDIVFEGENGNKYGIEVKSSTSGKLKSWKINGNSIVGSTRTPDLEEICIVFGKTHKNFLEFRAKKYSDSIANIAVTHSPRYIIDLDVDPSNTFFAKSKIRYQDLVESDNPIQMVTSYFFEKGERAWWLSESTPATIRLFSELPRAEKEDYIGYGMAHFPEILSSDQRKYYRYAAWMVTEHSVVCSSLRDIFSASGQVMITTDRNTYENLPRIFEKIKTHKNSIVNALDEAEPDTLISDWGLDIGLSDDLHEKLSAWKEIAISNLDNLCMGTKEISVIKEIVDFIFI